MRKRALAILIGGIVAYGSNVSTARQAAAELQAAEARRAELIDASNLRLVGYPGGTLTAKLS